MDTEVSRHGVVVTPNRKQPYAVWFRGEIILFTALLSEANRAFNAEEKRKARR
jgi:hypothetical protein